jgi:hypothetical protein
MITTNRPEHFGMEFGKVPVWPITASPALSIGADYENLDQFDHHSSLLGIMPLRSVSALCRRGQPQRPLPQGFAIGPSGRRTND